MESGEGKQISFRRLVYEALPEIWSFQLLAGVLLQLPAGLLRLLMRWVSQSSGTVLTTANLRGFLLSWRLPALLALGALLIAVYVLMELFVQIYLTADILDGNRGRLRQELGKGLRSLQRFWNPAGILALLYIFLAVPLCGIGLSISLSRTFYIPNFIMEVVEATPLYSAAYALLLLLLAWVGVRAAFTLHAVLLDGKTPAEGYRVSVDLVRANRRQFLLGMLKLLLGLALLQIVVSLLVSFLPMEALQRWGETLPRNYHIDYAAFDATGAAVFSYRFLSALAVLGGTYLESLAVLLGGAYLMLRLTRFYLAFTCGPRETWPERPKKSRYRRKVLLVAGVFLFIFVASAVIGLFFEPLVERSEPVKIIAHRAGGTLAAENSLAGLNAAIENRCYGSEIDVQRTKDGYYIVNHDNDFQRLTGVAKTPQELTLAEVRALPLLEGGGAIPTLEEMLDVTKGREKLFIELKGATADRQMVDDVVRIVREKDCVNGVALISLNYDVIDYAETNYPEFETGTLFFAGIGDVSRLNCDNLIMEEEMAGGTHVDQAHRAGKAAIVWTVNTRDSMYRFLDSEIDAIITDEVLLAKEVREELEQRTDFEILQDRLGGFWG